MTPRRVKGKPIFDPTALDNDLDDLWPAKTEPTNAAPPPPVSVVRPLAASPEVASQQPDRDDSSAPAQSGTPTQDTVTPVAAPQPTPVRRMRSVGTPTAATLKAQTRYRPPEVLLSAEVYDAFYRNQIAEKKARRGLARSMGVIVLDAIEKHAARLATTWDTAEESVGEGGLFVRPSSSAVPRRRRHAVAPRTVVLSGVNADNGQRLDDLVSTWGAATRSALVEQALRYEFDLT